MTRAAATAPARPSPAGSTSSSRRSATRTACGRAGRSGADHARDPHPPDRAAGQEPAAPPHAAGASGKAGAPLVIFDAGYSAAALTAALAGQDVHLLIRLASGKV